MKKQRVKRNPSWESFRIACGSMEETAMTDMKPALK